MGGFEEKQYKRCEYIIDKLKRTFPNYIYNKDNEQELIEKEIIRVRNFNDLAYYDIINISFLISVALLGLNKENIEKNDKHSDYEYPVKHKDTRVVTHPEASKELKLEAERKKEWFDDLIDTELKRGRIKNTAYDKWLSIKNENISQNSNYIFNIRNSLMHSEYYIGLLEDKPLFAHLINSNYTGFEADVFINKYLEFIKHYFSNDPFFGVVDDLYLFYFSEDNNVNNDLELKSFINNQFKVIKLDYENKKKRKLLESVLVTDPNKLSKDLIEKYNIKSSDVILDDEQINQMVLTIKDYYGDDIYDMEPRELEKIIVESARFELNPKLVISSWLMHFYDMFSNISCLSHIDDNFISGFALKPTLLVLKSYNVLYRLQNKELQKLGFNYELMDDINYSFDINDYSSFRDKLIDKSDYYDELDTKKKYFTEIFRNSLAHGNIDFYSVEENGNIERYIKFEDKYKSRNRIVSVSLDEFDKYLSSKCFESSQLKDNLEKVSVHTK